MINEDSYLTFSDKLSCKQVPWNLCFRKKGPAPSVAQRVRVQGRGHLGCVDREEVVLLVCVVWEPGEGGSWGRGMACSVMEVGSHRVTDNI